jgi:hypothetical protein
VSIRGKPSAAALHHGERAARLELPNDVTARNALGEAGCEGETKQAVAERLRGDFLVAAKFSFVPHRKVKRHRYRFHSAS